MKRAVRIKKVKSNKPTNIKGEFIFNE